MLEGHGAKGFSRTSWCASLFFIGRASLVPQRRDEVHTIAGLCIGCGKHYADTGHVSAPQMHEVRLSHRAHNALRDVLADIQPVSRPVQRKWSTP